MLYLLPFGAGDDFKLPAHKLIRFTIVIECHFKFRAYIKVPHEENIRQIHYVLLKLTCLTFVQVPDTHKNILPTTITMRSRQIIWWKGKYGFFQERDLIIEAYFRKESFTAILELTFVSMQDCHILIRIEFKRVTKTRWTTSVCKTKNEQNLLLVYIP